MKLQYIAELGYTCGLWTLGEAITCAELHWDAWQPGEFMELAGDIVRAQENDIGYDMLCVHFLGAERCAEMDAELDAYFDSSHMDYPSGNIDVRKT